jgi:hypothetical protein
MDDNDIIAEAFLEEEELGVQERLYNNEFAIAELNEKFDKLSTDINSKFEALMNVITSEQARAEPKAAPVIPAAPTTPAVRVPPKQNPLFFAKPERLSTTPGYTFPKTPKVAEEKKEDLLEDEPVLEKSSKSESRRVSLMERKLNQAEEAVEKSRGSLGNVNITVTPPSPSEMSTWELAKADVNSIITWTEIIEAARQRHPHLSFKRTSLLTATVWNRLQKNLQTKSKTHPFAKESLLDWVNRFSWSDIKLMQILSVSHACVSKVDFNDKFQAEVAFPHVATGFVLNPWNVHTIYDKETTYSMRAKKWLEFKLVDPSHNLHECLPDLTDKYTGFAKVFFEQFPGGTGQGIHIRIESAFLKDPKTTMAMYIDRFDAEVADMLADHEKEKKNLRDLGLKDPAHADLQREERAALREPTSKATTTKPFNRGRYSTPTMSNLEQVQSSCPFDLEQMAFCAIAPVEVEKSPGGCYGLVIYGKCNKPPGTCSKEHENKRVLEETAAHHLKLALKSKHLPSSLRAKDTMVNNRPKMAAHFGEDIVAQENNAEIPDEDDIEYSGDVKEEDLGLLDRLLRESQRDHFSMIQGPTFAQLIDLLQPHIRQVAPMYAHAEVHLGGVTLFCRARLLLMVVPQVCHMSVWILSKNIPLSMLR